MRPPSRSLLLALAGALVTTVVVVVGVLAVVRSGEVSGSGEDDAAAPVLVTLEQLAQDPPPVRRAGFCDRVGPDEVVSALGEPVTAVESYDNGDTAVLGEGVEDVAHEYGCRWTAASGAEARAWVFVPPVAAGRAERLVALAGRREGCAAPPAAPAAPGPAYGEPGVVTTCTDPATGALTVAHQGLFGDAWLSCTLSAPAATATEPAAEPVDPVAMAERAEAWCVGVAVAAGQAG